MPEDTPLDVVAFDEALVVVDKPAGLPSVPGRAAGLDDCAWSRLRRTFADALVVHRLDMATSGLLVFARGAAMQRALSRAFAERQVRKRYVAQLHGLLRDDEGCVDLPLIADWPNRPRQKVDHDEGKAALTRWRVLWRDPLGTRTLVALEPLTGRTHQLRVHMQALGHAIVGDTLYGGGGAHTEPMRLHALSIELPHPAHAQPVCYRTKEPPWLSNTPIPPTKPGAGNVA